MACVGADLKKKVYDTGLGTEKLLNGVERHGQVDIAFEIFRFPQTVKLLGTILNLPL